MNTRNTQPESRIKIRFPDCDPFNHLHNSRYIDYLITAREDQVLEHYGLDLHRLGVEQGLGWVSAQTQIAYLQPAFLMETVTVQTSLLAASEKSVLLEALMWNEEKTTLKCVLWTRLVHYHIGEQKSHPHAPELQQLFTELLRPLPDGTGFEERVQQLRANRQPAA